MKSSFYPFLAGIIPLLLAFSGLLAQESKYNMPQSQNSANDLALNSGPGKKFTWIKPDDSSPKVLNRAMKDFNSLINDQSHATWFDISEGYLAQSQDQEITAKVFYDRKGNRIALAKSYSENMMPKDIRRLVRSR